MAILFPTSSDIYLEVNGQKVAVVESYKAKSQRDCFYIEAFGESDPVGTVAGKTRHVVELSRVYVTDAFSKDAVNFHELAGFNLVIVKPDVKIVYTDCEWSSISEAAALHDTVIETVTLVSPKRLEMKNA